MPLWQQPRWSPWGADEAPPEKDDAPAEKSVIGATAKLTLGDTGIEFPARIDTGAKTCSLHVEEWEIQDEAGNDARQHRKDDPVPHPRSPGRGDRENGSNRKWSATPSTKPVKKESGGYKVKVKLRWKDLEKEVLVNLNDRSKMEFPLLVGRNYLRGDIVVDVDIDNDE